MGMEERYCGKEEAVEAEPFSASPKNPFQIPVSMDECAQKCPFGLAALPDLPKRPLLALQSPEIFCMPYVGLSLKL